MGKYQDFISAITGTPPSKSWSNFRQHFNKYKTIILDIKNNGESYDLNKWEDLFNRYNTIDPIVLAICHHKNCPDLVIDKVIENVAINKTAAGMDINAIISAILKRDILSQTQIDNIVNKYNVINLFPATFHRVANEVYERPFNEDITNKVIKSLYDKDGAKMNTAVLLYLSDRELLDKIIRENINNESIRDIVVNNLYLTENERNQVFDFGCDRTEIGHPTKYMLENMYRESVEAYFENDFKTAETVEERKILEDAYYKGFSFLQYMIRNNMITSDMEIDLINRFANLKERAQNGVLGELLKNTKNDQVFLIAEKSIVSKDKECIYTNVNCPQGVIYRKAYGLMLKIDRALLHNKPISDSWTQSLSNMMNRVNLTPDYEDVFLRVRDKSLHKPLACAPFTSIETLEKIENDKSKPIVGMIAGVNKTLQKAGFYGDQLKSYMYFLGFRLHISMVNTGFNTAIANMTNFQKLITSDLSSAEIAVKELKKYRDTEIESRAQKSLDFQSKRYLDFYIKSIEYVVLREKEYDNKTLETTNTQKLQEIQRDMVNDIKKYSSSYDAVLKIEENVDKFNRIKEILIDRNKDTILEKIEPKIEEER